METETEEQKTSTLLADLFKIIERYETDFETKHPEIAPGYSFDQLGTINRINLYYASQFQNGNKDENGDDIFFYNITKPKIKNAKKNIDFDSKDVLTRSVSGRKVRKAWLLRRDLYNWMRKRRIGSLINESAGLICQYGTVVAKKVGKGRILELVDLRNLRNDPTAKTLRYSWKIIEHFYTPNELREMSNLWDKAQIERAIHSFTTNCKENFVDMSRTDVSQGDAQYIHVIEFYDNVPEDWLKEGGNPDNYIRGQFVVVKPEGSSDKEIAAKFSEGLVLYKKEIPADDVEKNENNDLFRECHFDRITGRWLGCGLGEENFEAQVAKNESFNQIILAMRLANLILFVTDDKTFPQNILEECVNGDIKQLKGSLQRVDTIVRNMPANNIISQEITNLSNQLSNSFEVTTGESLPSGTPFALGQMLNVQAMKYYIFVRQDFAMFWEEIFNDWILPEAAKALTKKHTLEITSKEEMEWLAEEFGKENLWTAIKKLMMTGKLPTIGDIEMASQVLEQRFKNKESIYLGIPEKFYTQEDLDDIEAVISGESFDKKERLITFSTIMQMMGANPKLLESPIFQQVLDISGLGAVDVAPQTPQTIEMGNTPTAPPTPSPAMV